MGMWALLTLAKKIVWRQGRGCSDLKGGCALERFHSRHSRKPSLLRQAGSLPRVADRAAFMPTLPITAGPGVRGELRRPPIVASILFCI